MHRTSSALWQGDGMHGTGKLSMQSGVLQDQPYSFQTRFVSEDGRAGTNPEELLGAAHAGCFAMALSFALTKSGHIPAEIKVVAKVDLSQVEGGFEIKNMGLDLEAHIPNIDEAEFLAIAELAKKNCPVSKALASTSITLSAKLNP